MSHLHPLISDLALLLLFAAGATLLFKKLKQPLVLGYIVAGFLANGTISIMPSVSDSGTISIWAEIGIIFLLFSLGLEFSFKKLFKVGSTALISALMIVSGMMSVGFCVGKLLGWATIDSVFLGAMLSMSSTTIIIKAFEDLGITKQRFTSIVFGILIVEDLFAILLLVLLSTIKGSWDGMEFLNSAFSLVFFILLWFIGGLYLIPLFLRKVKSLVNNEVLLILSLGLCMGMVVFANAVGFSSALGAFVMGSILAETVEAEQIERVSNPVKHLFGAIFFVSVGMMIQPELIAEHWIPIVVITFTVIIGQILLSTTGVLLSGQPLKTAIQSGFSLAQIGEFAFIIAALGMNLGLTSPSLYPIAATVSIITTFATPFFIRNANPFYRWLESKLSPRTILVLDELGASNQTASRNDEWSTYRRKYWLFISLHIILIGGIILLAKEYLLPFLKGHIPTYWSNIIAVSTTTLAIAPLLWTLLFRPIHSETHTKLWDDSRFNHALLIAMRLLRIVIAVGLIAYLFTSVLHYSHGLILFLILTILPLILFGKKIRTGIFNFENQIKQHLSAREHHSGRNIKTLVSEIQIASFVVSPNSDWVGRYFYKADFRKHFGVSIVCIKRGDNTLFIPGARDQIFPYDTVTVVGSDEALISFAKEVELGLLGGEWMDVSSQTDIDLKPFLIHGESYLCNHTLSEIDIRSHANVMLVGIERNGGRTVFPSAETKLHPDDLVWAVGTAEDLERFSHLTYQNGEAIAEEQR